MVPTGQTTNDYLRQLVGAHYKVGMTEWDMVFLLAGSGALVTDSLNDLYRKWAGNSATGTGNTIWYWLRRLTGSRFKTGDTKNDMLRKLVAAS